MYHAAVAPPPNGECPRAAGHKSSDTRPQPSGRSNSGQEAEGALTGRPPSARASAQVCLLPDRARASAPPVRLRAQPADVVGRRLLLTVGTVRRLTELDVPGVVREPTGRGALAARSPDRHSRATLLAVASPQPNAAGSTARCTGARVVAIRITSWLGWYRFARDSLCCGHAVAAPSATCASLWGCEAGRRDWREAEPR